MIAITVFIVANTGIRVRFIVTYHKDEVLNPNRIVSDIVIMSLQNRAEPVAATAIARIAFTRIAIIEKRKLVSALNISCLKYFLF